MTAPVLLHGITGDAISGAPRSPDLEDQTVRVAARGELVVTNLFNGTAGLAAEGSYWVAATATPGTGITLSVATGTTFSDTQALLGINNTELSSGSTGGAGQGKSIYLDFVTIVITAAGTATTSEHVAHRIDTGNRVSGGTQLVPHPVHMGFGGTPVGTCFTGNPTIAAATGFVRNVGRNILRIAASPAFIVSDSVTIKYGSQEFAAGGVGASATVASAITVYAPPVVIAPGQSYVLNEWGVARSAAISGEVIVGWYER